MKNKVFMLGSLLMMAATMVNAQVDKDFQGNYSVNIDPSLLFSNLSENSKQTVTIETGLSKERKSSEEIEKMALEAATELSAEVVSEMKEVKKVTTEVVRKGSRAISGIIVKANSIESFDKATGKSSVMYSFEDKDVEKVSNGYKITTKDGEVITLIRKDKQTLVIPERGFVLKKK